MDWWNFMTQSVAVGAQLLWSGRYGCNNGRYGCTIVMSYIEINKAVSQWLLTFNLCVSVTWPLTCAFHIPCTHTPEIIDMHRGMCDKLMNQWHGYCGEIAQILLKHLPVDKMAQSPGDNFKCNSMNENSSVSTDSLLKSIPVGVIYEKSSLVKTKA